MRIKYNTLQNRNIADVLFVTATEVETKALHSYLKPICSDGILEIEKDNVVYYAGVFDRYNIIHCQCTNMGTQEIGSSIIQTTQAISDWNNIKAVIMLGVAFGMYEDEGETPQHFSDVIIASKILPYENQRVNPDGTTTYRGKEHYPSSNLLDAFAVVKQKWKRKNILGQDTNIEISPVLSGEKLVDNIEFRNKLKNEHKAYRGGEMEGIGIAASCEKAGLPWILLKSICDFADGGKGNNKKNKQEDAAKAAVEACLMAFSTPNFATVIGDSINYSYCHEEVNLNNVFFINYSDECEPYYLNRAIDNEILPYVLSKTCWVYGKSGIGKSNLLLRLLHINKVQYVYIDLSLSSKIDVIDSFYEILLQICDFFRVEMLAVSQLSQVIKEICNVLNANCKNKNFYLLIDEIPFEYKSNVFAEFAYWFCKMIQYCDKHMNNSHIYFMLSSIAEPISSFIDMDQLHKIEQHIKFIKMDEWTNEQASSLIMTLNKYVNLKWNDLGIDEFAQEYENSPRAIKNALKEMCSLGIREVNHTIINRLKYK